MTGIPSLKLQAETLLRDHFAINPTSSRLNFPSGHLWGQKFPMIPTHPNRNSWSPTASPVFQQTPQLEGGMEIVLEDTKDAIGGSLVIVFMDDNMIFFIIIKGLMGILLWV